MKKILLTILAFGFISAHAQGIRNIDKNLQKSATSFPVQLDVDTDQTASDGIGIQCLDPTYGATAWFQNDVGTIAGLFMNRSASPFSSEGTFEIMNNNDILLSPGNTQLVFLTSAGNVGIGNSTPTSLLDVSGTIKTTTTSGTVGLNLSESNNHADLRIIRNTLNPMDNNLYFNWQAGMGSELHFYSNDVETITASNGRIGINDPSSSLQMLRIIQQLNHGLSIANSTNNSEFEFWVNANANGQLNLWHNNGSIGNFDAISGVYTATSDKRLKRNIRQLEPVLDKVNQLEASRYNFKKDNQNREYIGFLAQDVEILFPELVHISDDEKNGELYTLDYSGFGIVAIKAIQELSEENNELKERIAALEEVVDALIKK